MPLMGDRAQSLRSRAENTTHVRAGKQSCDDAVKVRAERVRRLGRIVLVRRDWDPVPPVFSEPACPGDIVSFLEPEV